MTRRLKVLLVINGLGTGGSERSLAELLPRFTNGGITPIVACLYRRNSGIYHEVREQGFDIRLLRSRNLLGWVSELRSLIREEAPDLVHTSLFESDIAGRIAAHRRTPVMTSLVNVTYDRARRSDPHIRWTRLRAAQAVDSATARYLTAHFHAVSRTVRDAAIRDLGLPPDSVTVIERGRDERRLGEPSLSRRRSARRDLGLEEDGLVLVSVGRQEYQKGQALLLEAMPLVLRNHSNVTLLLAGREGNVSTALYRQHAESRLGSRVRLLGHIDNVPDLLAASDIFIMPSIYEGLPGAIIEAMALALPIIASNISSVQEAVGPKGNAVLIPRTVPALVSAIDQLICAPELRHRLGAQVRARFLELFTLDSSARRLSELYRSVVDKGSSGQSPLGSAAPSSFPRR